MKFVLTIFAFLVIAMGGLWAGQGSGLINWPESSFMIGQQHWTWWGVVLTLLGFIILYRALRR